MAEPIRYNRMEHIFLRDKLDNRKYKSTPKVVPPPPKPDRDRFSHAERLEKQFDTAWDEAEIRADERKAQLLPARNGVYLEFNSMPGFDLNTRSLENSKQGIRLLSTRERDNTVLATVYVPNTRRKFFFNKVRQYRDELTSNDKPKNQALIDSLESVILADIDAFWSDDISLLPIGRKDKCEIWLDGSEETVRIEFAQVCRKLEIPLDDGYIVFPDRTVLLVTADDQQLRELINSSDSIAEIRLAKETASFFLNLENDDQADWAAELLSRLTINGAARVAVCVLDTGANNRHPLLHPLLPDASCQSVNPTWNPNDVAGHGTLMCGTAGYGNLRDVLLRSRIRVCDL